LNPPIFIKSFCSRLNPTLNIPAINILLLKIFRLLLMFNDKRNETSFGGLMVLKNIWTNRFLIGILIRREIAVRYRGSIFGVFWSVINPIFMLSIYTFVFGVVFKARWNVGSDSKTEFALVLFSGLVTFNIFSENINRAPTLIVSNLNYVKKVIFPLEILPIVVLGVSIYNGIIGYVLWFIAYLFFFGLPEVTSLLLPVVLLPLIFISLGVSWFLASLSVYIRDISQFIGIVTSVLIFLSPVFYPISGVPEAYRGWLMLNPLTPTIEQVRGVLFWGEYPNLFMLLINFFCGILVAGAGLMWFQKTRKGFADVI
jgi:lipopolysaccharide transport system permease protein